jgi:lipopolysaccharide export system protein LptC
VKLSRDPMKALAEPLARRDRPRIDWTARTRGTVLDARRYSQFVGVMKRALPIAAGAIIMAVVAYTLMPRPADRASINIEYPRMGVIENDLAMIKPKLTGTDEKGNPFVITAEAAIQDGRNTRRARLRKVEADMTLDDQRWLNATAENGFIDADKGKLSLGGGIALYSDNGYELHTESVHVDLGKGFVSGNQKVTGQGPMGALAADRFTVDRRKQVINLYGNVHTTIYEGAK